MKEDFDWDFADKLDYKIRPIIDFANLKGNLFAPVKEYLDYSGWVNFLKNRSYGIPIMLPDKLSMFNYPDNSVDSKSFDLNIKDISKGIFNTNRIDYIGVKIFAENGLSFKSSGDPKKEIIPFINNVQKFNNNTKKLIEKIKLSNKTIAAFQCRNVPHFGHQAIVESLMSKADVVVINPILGPKKPGDIKPDCLRATWQYLIKNYYGEKVKFWPVIANMFYAGPREAAHHAIIRSNLGFNYFSVGRDHAGAENIYQDEEASIFVINHERKFNIKIIANRGAYFCSSCKKAVIRGACPHKEEGLEDISGSDFRKHIENKKIYKFADKNLQEFVFEMKGSIFE